MANHSVHQHNAREGAFDVLSQIEDGAYANLALDAWLEGPGRGLTHADKRLATELVFGVVKNRLTLDWIIDRRVEKLNRLRTGPRIILRLGLFQLCYLDKIPARAAVYEAVELAGRRFNRGAASLVNAVFRGMLRDKLVVAWPDEKQDPAQYLSVRFSHPLWMAERWLARYGMEDAQAFCQYNNAPAPLWIRANTLRVTPESLAGRLQGEGCRVEPGSFAPEALRLQGSPGIRNLASFQEGLFTVQDESSMLAAHALAPLPGQSVLDLCAAPGGKATHLAQLMGDRGAVAAWDIHPHRVELIREAQRRLGIRCIEALCKDASAQPDGQPESCLYDRILVDAPCSGLGVLRRRADARWNRKPEDIPRLAGVQEKILRNALSMLAPGGRLLYCTCTTEPEENRLLIEKVLADSPGCTKGLLSLPALRDCPGREPAGGWDIQLLPFIHGLEGFYMAAIEKPGRQSYRPSDIGTACDTTGGLGGSHG